MVVHHNNIIMRTIHQNALMWVENMPKFLIDFSEDILLGGLQRGTGRGMPI